MLSRQDRNRVAKAAVDTHPVIPYPHRLNFYEKPPLQEVTIEDFETCALERLRVLAEIESCFARNRPWKELKDVILELCKKHYPLHASTAKHEDTQAERRKDHIGHYVLRLAFCRSEELRRRFVKAETALFRIRYESDDTQELEQFLASQKDALPWEIVGEEEKNLYLPQLKAAAESFPPPPNTTPINFDKEKYYKVAWTSVPDLVEKRKVFLRRGKAYVPAQEQSSIVFEEFQRNLEKALLLTLKHLPRLDEDTRIVPLLNNLSQGFLAGVPAEWTSATSSANGDELTADMVDDVARKHFPMCMRHLHDTLRKDKHLKHYGRLQYGLFLKVLGLSIEEALAFWRRSFSTMQDDKFNKEYKYNIRHSYGLEGKRANYPAKSCQQILTADQPGPQDSHGCPYRHFSPENLQTALLSMYSSQGLTSRDLPEILTTVKAGHYHVACTRVFEITHAAQGVKKGEGVGEGESVTHPNQYAARSRELEKKLKEEADGDVSMA